MDDNVPAGPMGQLMFEMYKSLKGTPKRPRWSSAGKPRTPPPRPPNHSFFFGMVFEVVLEVFSGQCGVLLGTFFHHFVDEKRHRFFD